MQEVVLQIIAFEILVDQLLFVFGGWGGGLRGRKLFGATEKIPFFLFNNMKEKKNFVFFWTCGLSNKFVLDL